MRHLAVYNSDYVRISQLSRQGQACYIVFAFNLTR